MLIASFILGLAVWLAATSSVMRTLVVPRGSSGINRVKNNAIMAKVYDLALFAGMGLVAVHFVAQSAEFGDKAAIFYFPLWPIQLVMPYAFFSCAFRHLAYALHPELRPQGVLA